MRQHARSRSHSDRLTRTVFINALALVIGISGVFYALTADSSGGMGSKAQRMVAAAASLTLGVEPNPYNTLDAQLTAKQNELDQREAAIASKESSGTADVYGLASFCISIVLLILVAINFYYDRKMRGNRTAIMPGKFSVDLR